MALLVRFPIVDGSVKLPGLFDDLLVSFDDSLVEVLCGLHRGVKVWM